MIVRVDAREGEQMIADGVRTVDVLPASVFRQEHLPGAVNVPLQTFEPAQVEPFARRDPVLVYCFDQQ